MTPPYLILLSKIPGLDRHEVDKLARKNGSGVTDEALTFKKPFQTVIRPQTTDHNIHDDYLKHPPEVRSLDNRAHINMQLSIIEHSPGATG